MSQEPRVHYYYETQPYALPTFCRPTLGGERTMSTRDPARVTCEACRRKMAKWFGTRQEKPR